MRAAVLFVFAGLTACSDTGELILPISTAMGGADGGSVRIGNPCTPDLEQSPTFSAFGLNETWVESSMGAPSGSAVCLAYHFQGRISCPYGQGLGDARNPQCATPDGALVTGPAEDPSGAPVLPQCLDRRADAVVVWSCRCANARGKTDDEQHTVRALRTWRAYRRATVSVLPMTRATAAHIACL